MKWPISPMGVRSRLYEASFAETTQNLTKACA